MAGMAPWLGGFLTLDLWVAGEWVDRSGRAHGLRRAQGVHRLPHHQDSALARRPLRPQGEMRSDLLLLLFPFSICALFSPGFSVADPPDLCFFFFALIQSLFNACGIRYRKKRREALGLDAGEGGAERQEKKKSKRERGEEVTMELRMVGFGKEVVLKQRRRMRRRRRLGEEEKAAILLMALSSGVIYA